MRCTLVILPLVLTAVTIDISMILLDSYIHIKDSNKIRDNYIDCALYFNEGSFWAGGRCGSANRVQRGVKVSGLVHSTHHQVPGYGVTDGGALPAP